MGFSLYIHIPYCDSKCPYCDFNSHAVPRWPEERYVAALRREIEQAVSPVGADDVPIESVFLGGGTPSLFSAGSIAEILSAVTARWTLSGGAEVTMEANPGTVDRSALAGYRDAGVNRISFGVQSFDDELLQRLGRIHDGATAVAAVEAARAGGFDNINVDLMFAVPGQSTGQWCDDLRRAVDLGTPHVSAYNLTFEEGTAYFAMRARGELRQLDESLEVEMYGVTGEILAASGFVRYEISNYSQPDFECRHNLGYWRLRPYLGVGAGAHSYAIEPRRRWRNQLGPEAYMTEVESCGHARTHEEELSPGQARGEFAFLGLRCLDGVAEEDFQSRFGVTMVEAFPHCEGLRSGGLLQANEGRWRLTARGLMVADEVFATFV